MSKLVVTDPCLEDDNYQLLLRTLWERYGATVHGPDYEHEAIRSVMTKLFLVITPETELLLGLKQGFRQDIFLDLADWDVLNKCRRPPWEVIDLLKRKRGYIIDDKKYLVRWEGMHAAFFLDPPEELYEHFRTPLLSIIAKWRLQCYEDFIRRYNEGSHA